MRDQQEANDREPRGKPVSLNPLRFKEAVADLLKVRPPEKPEKAKTSGKKAR